MRLRTLLAVVLTGVLLIAGVLAQDAPTPTPDGVTILNADVCGTALSQFWLNASNACVGKEFGFVCNGGSSPQAEPQGAVSNSLSALGALVETGFVGALRTEALAGDGSRGGIVWLRVAAPDTLVQYSALLIGDVLVRNVTPDGFPRWQSITVRTREAPQRCEIGPISSLVLQSLPNQSARVVVNGVSVDLRGTVVIQTEGTLTHFLNVAGSMGVISAGQRQELVAGQEVSVQYEDDDFTRPVGGLGVPVAFQRDRVDHLPIVLFDRPIQVPQAGFAFTQGAVNLRTAPTTDAAVQVQVPAGERLTLLGQNPAGDWYHVRLASGLTGWMFAELLGGEVGQIENVYIETPQPVQRLGDLGFKARVIAPNGVTLRSAPDLGFSPLASLPFGADVNLLARSPYSPWVKIDVSGQIGWAPLIGLETRAIVDAIPVDYDVPPPPQPTRIPGSFGNAFPDPNCYPNCG